MVSTPPVMSKLAPQEEKFIIESFRRLFLEEDGTTIKPDAHVVIRSMMIYSKMFDVTERVNRDNLEQYLGRKDMVVYMMRQIYHKDDLTYFTNMINMSIDEINNEELY